VLAVCFIIDLPDSGGAEKTGNLGVPVRTLVSFEGHYQRPREAEAPLRRISRAMSVFVRPLLQNYSRRLESPSGELPDKNLVKLSKVIGRAVLAEVAGRQRFCQSIFAQPRPIEDSGKAPQTLLVSSLPGQLWLVGFLVRVGLPRPKQNFILARDM